MYTYKYMYSCSVRIVPLTYRYVPYAATTPAVAAYLMVIPPPPPPMFFVATTD